MTYTDRQIDTMLNMYLRPGPRHAPWPEVARALGLDASADVIRKLPMMLWKVSTGYIGSKACGRRRVYMRTELRVDRTGFPWLRRELVIIKSALMEEGQQRNPPCDPSYVAAVLARSPAEVVVQLHRLKSDVLGRRGFGLVAGCRDE